MIKGTITTPDFYGKVQSIESPKQTLINTEVISKRTGKRYKITSVTLVTVAFQLKDIRITLSSNNTPVAKNIDFDTLKHFYWKVG